MDDYIILLFDTKYKCQWINVVNTILMRRLRT